MGGALNLVATGAQPCRSSRIESELGFCCSLVFVLQAYFLYRSKIDRALSQGFSVASTQFSALDPKVGELSGGHWLVQSCRDSREVEPCQGIFKPCLASTPYQRALKYQLGQWLGRCIRRGLSA